MRIFILIFSLLVVSTVVGCKSEKVVPSIDTSKAAAVSTPVVDEAATELELPPPMHMLFSATEYAETDLAQTAKNRAWESAAERLADLFRSCGYSGGLGGPNPPNKELDGLYLTWTDSQIIVWMSPRAFREYTMSELRRLHAGTAKTKQVTTCLQKFGYLQ